MSEKLCLKWSEFQDNVKVAFGSLREENEFADVTLACKDGQQIEESSGRQLSHGLTPDGSYHIKKFPRF